MKSNIQLKSDALEALGKDKWGISIGGFLIYIIITQAIGLIPFIGAIAGFILTGPFVVGLYFFFLKVSRGDHVEIEDLFVAFKNRNQLKEIFLLIDIRHKLQIIDLEFMNFLKSIDRDFTIIFTKKDKIKDTVVANYCKDFLKSIENIYDKEEYFVSSSKTRYGREDILEYISKVSH